MYDSNLMLLMDFRESLLSFELIYFRNSFCYRTENSWSFKYKILSHVSPLEENLSFLYPLGLLKYYHFLSGLFILKFSYSKLFCNTLNYASTVNIEQVMKFCNLGNKTFETDFNGTVRKEGNVRDIKWLKGQMKIVSNQLLIWLTSYVFLLHDMI